MVYKIHFNIVLDSPCHSILLPIWSSSYTTEYSMEKIVWKSISVHNKINCLPTYTHCLQCLQVGKQETCNDKDIGSITGSSMAKFDKLNQYLNKSLYKKCLIASNRLIAMAQILTLAQSYIKWILLLRSYDIFWSKIMCF